MELGPGDDLESFAETLARSTGERASDPDRPEAVTAALAHVFVGERKLLVLGGCADVEEPIVDARAGFVRSPGGRGQPRLLAPESTPARCRVSVEAHGPRGPV